MGGAHQTERRHGSIAPLSYSLGCVLNRWARHRIKRWRRLQRPREALGLARASNQEPAFSTLYDRIITVGAQPGALIGI